MEVREELLQIWVPARRWGLSSQHPGGRDRQIELRGQPDLQSKVQASQLDSEILYPKKKEKEKENRKPNTQKLPIWAGGHSSPSWSVLTAAPASGMLQRPNCYDPKVESEAHLSDLFHHQGALAFGRSQESFVPPLYPSLPELGKLSSPSPDQERSESL